MSTLLSAKKKLEATSPLKKRLDDGFSFENFSISRDEVALFEIFFFLHTYYTRE